MHMTFSNSPATICKLDVFHLSSDNSTARNSVIDNHIIPGYNSDHAVVSLNLIFIQNEKGHGYFKLNNSLLLKQN